MTAKEKILNYCYMRYRMRVFTTSDVILGGSENHYPINRADRNARQLAEDGLFQRISASDHHKYGYHGKEGLYLITDKGREQAQGLGQLQLF